MLPQRLPLRQHHSQLLVATLPGCLVSLSDLSLAVRLDAAAPGCLLAPRRCFFSCLLQSAAKKSVLTQDALPRCNGRLGSCSNLLLCGHAKAGSSRCRTCCCCNCLHSRCARSKVIRNAMERDWDATFLEREEVTRSGTTRTCCTDVWLAALVWLDAGDSAPSRLPSVVAARSSAT